MLCKDKALAKKLLAFHRSASPASWSRRASGRSSACGKFAYPAFVKPVGEESSDGIAMASLAKNEEEAIERARFLHERFESDALIEEYVDGRELYLGVLGNKRLTVFPPREIFFGEPPAGEDGPAVRDGEGQVGRRLPEEVEDPERPGRPAAARASSASSPSSRAGSTASCTSAAWGASTSRLTPEGEIVVIEANPNPSLAKEDDFAQAAAQVGIGYEALIQKLLENALRWKGEPPG